MENWKQQLSLVRVLHACLHIHMYAVVCEGRGLTSSIFLYLFPLHFFSDKISHWTWNSWFSQTNWPANYTDPAPHLYIPSPGISGADHYAWCLHSKYFPTEPSLRPSLSPLFSFWLISSKMPLLRFSCALLLLFICPGFLVSKQKWPQMQVCLDLCTL